MEYFTDIDKEGKPQPTVMQQLLKDFAVFAGKRIHIKVDKATSKRSHQQNAYYWVLINILSREVGYDPTELHEIVKFKFLTEEKVDVNTGEIFRFTKSTTKLNKTQFGDFIDKLHRWSSETFHCALPDAAQYIDEQNNN